MKLLSVAVPCYNSAAYMRRCVDSLLPGGEEVEILIIDDGSADETLSIARAYEQEHPGVVRAIHQKNAGHGGAINTALRHASGLYFKVVDSDDWVDAAALDKVLDRLRHFAANHVDMDVLISNYVYDKAGARRKKVMQYRRALPRGTVLTWADVRHLPLGHYILMHSVIYRTRLLRDCGIRLPEHTFYVDNLFVYEPMRMVKTLYYLDVDLYHYFIGREDQSVHESVMLRRIDQQLRVNLRMLNAVDLEALSNGHQRQYLFSYLEIITMVSTILLLRAGTPEADRKRAALWEEIRQSAPWTYRRLRGGLMGRVAHLPGRPGRAVALACYAVAQKLFGFN